MPEPITPERLAELRKWHVERSRNYAVVHVADLAVRELLDHIDHLQGELDELKEAQ